MPKAIPKFIGARVTRREDPELVTGRGRYVADIPLPDGLTMAFVRSPYGHAKVSRVDTSSALAMKGVVTVLTGTDIHPHLATPFSVATGVDGGSFERLHLPDRYPLATDRVRCMGDPVAVVIAVDPYVATDGVEAVVVDYEPLPAVTTPEAALAEAAPLLYEDTTDNIAFVWKLTGGDVERAFANADCVSEIEISIQRLVPNAVEPRAVAASYDGDEWVLWSSTQIPHMLRDAVTKMLGVDKTALRVIAPEVGGGFGAKANIYTEEVLAAHLARRLRCSIRWVATRSEDFLVTSHGRDQLGAVRLAADESGRILGAELRITMDVGAHYSRVTPIIPALTGTMMTGVYDIPNVLCEARGVYTNKTMTEPYRGAGRPEAAYFIERAVDALSQKMGLDPIELRRRNFVRPDRFPYETATGLTYDSGEYARTLDELLKHVDVRALRLEQERRRREGGKLLGVGMASYVEICGFGPWEMGTVRIAPDGRVAVLTGTSPTGQGHETSWSQIVAETLQVPFEDITVLHGDTGTVPKGLGTFGSRSAPVGGAAVLESSERVREGAKEIAAHLLEASAPDIALEEGRFHVVGVPSRSVGWKEVAAAAHAEETPPDLRGKLDVESEFKPSGETYPFGVHAAVVEIDPSTGEIEIVRFVTVDDCGRVINPLLVEGQVQGGIAQGVGQALWERAVYDEDGNLLTGNLMEYAVPRADLLPSFETHRTETPTPLNPLGVKGIGEAATIGSTPAVVNAVVDAVAHLGVRHIDTPLTPEKIWKILS